MNEHKRHINRENLNFYLRKEIRLLKKLKATERNALLRWFFRSSYTSSLKYFRKKVFKCLDLHLLDTNEKYQMISRENHSMIAREKITMQPYKFARDNHTQKYDGRLTSNGHIYLECSAASWISDFNGFLPFKFEGKIDHFGRVTLHLVKTKWRYRTLPKKYTGFIDRKGNIEITAIAPSTEIFVPGSLNITHMICKIYSKNSAEMLKFESNKKKLRRMIFDCKQQMIAAINHNA